MTRTPRIGDGCVVLPIACLVLYLADLVGPIDRPVGLALLLLEPTLMAAALAPVSFVHQPATAASLPASV